MAGRSDDDGWSRDEPVVPSEPAASTLRVAGGVGELLLQAARAAQVARADSVRLMRGVEVEDREGADASAGDAWTLDRAARRSLPPTDAEGARRTWSSLPPRSLPAVVGGPVRDSEPRGSTSDPREALGLVERASLAPRPRADLATEMADAFALGNFSAALRAAELLLGRDGSHEAAQRYATASRLRLESFYASRLGGLERVPLLAVPDLDVRWLGLDHRAGFLLSRVDGVATCEELLDLAGMSRIEALRTLAELVDAGAIRFDES